jgi:sugar transferase EpsL
MNPDPRTADRRSAARAEYPLKRPLDVVLSLLVLTLLLLPMMVVSLLILVTLGRPVLFRQQRPGLRARPFTIMKFRTMRQGRGISSSSLAFCDSAHDAERLTGFGRFLRRTSLDELPELWNVLKGDMSLVGPRPLLMVYLDRYTPEQARRHDVRPGITGWAAVKGRAGLSYEERFLLDVWYVDHMSFWLDLGIMLRTPFEVFRGRGVQTPGYATGPEWLGGRDQAVAEKRRDRDSQS